MMRTPEAVIAAELDPEWLPESDGPPESAATCARDTDRAAPRSSAVLTRRSGFDSAWIDAWAQPDRKCAKLQCEGRELNPYRSYPTGT